jgi:uncharacterized SAM-binding protein YcdF (DUF218 family)
VEPGPVRTNAPPGPVKRRRWPTRLFWLALVVLLGLSTWFFRTPLLIEAGRFLDVSESPQKVDYVYVLGGDNDTRPFTAAALIKAGWAREALIPGESVSPAVTNGLIPPEHEIMRRVLIARGVRPESITILPGQASNTREEAAELAEFLRDHPDCTVAVITNGYHTRRARMHFVRALGDRIASVHFFAAPTDGYDATNWWHDDRGLIQFTNEFVKLAWQSVGGTD